MKFFFKRAIEKIRDPLGIIIPLTLLICVGIFYFYLDPKIKKSSIYKRICEKILNEPKVVATPTGYTGGPQPIKDIEVKVSKEDIGDTKRITVDLTIIPAIEDTTGIINIGYDEEIIFKNKNEFNFELDHYENKAWIYIYENTNKKNFKFVFEINKKSIKHQIITIYTSNAVMGTNIVNISLRDLKIKYHKKR